MIVHDEGGPVGDPQAVHASALLLDLLDLSEEFFDVDDSAVSDDCELAGPHDTGGESVEFEHLVADHDGVSGVVPSLETDDEICLLVEVVDNLSFTFVAPLGTDDC